MIGGLLIGVKAFTVAFLLYSAVKTLFNSKIKSAVGSAALVAVLLVGLFCIASRLGGLFDVRGLTGWGKAGMIISCAFAIIGGAFLFFGEELK